MQLDWNSPIPGHTNHDGDAQVIATFSRGPVQRHGGTKKQICFGAPVYFNVSFSARTSQLFCFRVTRARVCSALAFGAHASHITSLVDAWIQRGIYPTKAGYRGATWGATSPHVPFWLRWGPRCYDVFQLDYRLDSISHIL